MVSCCYGNYYYLSHNWTYEHANPHVNPLATKQIIFAQHFSFFSNNTWSICMCHMHDVRVYVVLFIFDCEKRISVWATAMLLVLVAPSPLSQLLHQMVLRLFIDYSNCLLQILRWHGVLFMALHLGRISVILHSNHSFVCTLCSQLVCMQILATELEQLWKCGKSLIALWFFYN